MCFGLVFNAFISFVNKHDSNKNAALFSYYLHIHANKLRSLNFLRKW